MPKLLSKFLCNHQDDAVRTRYQDNIRSELLQTISFDRKKTLLIVGKTRNHSFFLLESTHRTIRIELFKADVENNALVGLLFGDPCLIALRDVTNEKFRNVEILSNPIILTHEQTVKLLSKVEEKSVREIRYSSFGDHSVYSSLFSGEDYQNCNGFIIELLKDIGIVTDGKLDFHLVKLPVHALESIGVPAVVDLQRKNDVLEDENVRLRQLNHDLNMKLNQNERNQQ